MLELHATSQYRKDRKRVKRRGLHMDLLDEVVQTLIEERPLAPRHRDHEPFGRYAGFRECHVQPDWLLIYMKDDEQLILTATRTGSHSDLF